MDKLSKTWRSLKEKMPPEDNVLIKDRGHYRWSLYNRPNIPKELQTRLAVACGLLLYVGSLVSIQLNIPIPASVRSDLAEAKSDLTLVSVPIKQELTLYSNEVSGTRQEQPVVKKPIEPTLAKSDPVPPLLAPSRPIKEKSNTPRTGFAEFLFPDNYTPTMMNKIKQNADKEASFFGPDQIAEALFKKINTLDSTIRPIVKDPRLNIPPKDQENWIKLVKAIIAIESGGKIDAISTAQALGVMQSKREVLENSANKHHIPKYDLFNPWDNIFLSIQYLLDLKKSFHSFELTLAAYNIGPGTIAKCIAAMAKELGAEPGKVDQDFATMGLDGKSPPASKIYGERYNVTTAEMYSSNAVREILAKAEHKPNEIKNYFARIVGALKYIDKSAYQQLFGN